MEKMIAKKWISNFLYSMLILMKCISNHFVIYPQ